LQESQLLDAITHMLDVLIKQSIYLAAILVWCIPEFEQVPNFLQRHIQHTAAPDELKASR
jgi:hypothetical protein